MDTKTRQFRWGLLVVVSFVLALLGASGAGAEGLAGETQAPAAYQHNLSARVKVNGAWIELTKPMYFVDFYMGAWKGYDPAFPDVYVDPATNLFYMPNEVPGPFYIGKYGSVNFGDPETARQRLRVIKDAGLYPMIHVLSPHLILGGNGNYYLTDWTDYGAQVGGAYKVSYDLFHSLYRPILEEMRLPYILVYDLWGFTYFIPEDLPSDVLNRFYWNELEYFHSHMDFEDRPTDLHIRVHEYTSDSGDDAYRRVIYLMGGHNPKENAAGIICNSLQTSLYQALGDPGGTGTNPETGHSLGLNDFFWITWYEFTPNVRACPEVGSHGQRNIVTTNQSSDGDGDGTNEPDAVFAQAQREDAWVESVDSLGPRYFYGYIDHIRDGASAESPRHQWISGTNAQTQFLTYRALEKGMVFAGVWNEYAEGQALEPGRNLSPGGSADEHSAWLNNRPAFLDELVRRKISVTMPNELKVSFNNAEIVEGESSIPASMQPGETKTVTVRVRNSGSAGWRAVNAYALGSGGSNNVNWSGWTCGGYRDGSSNRAGLCREVKPGQTHDFTFNVTAPSSGATSVTLEVRMVQDGVEWFGETQRWTIPIQGTCANAALGVRDDKWKLEIWNNKTLSGATVEQRYDAAGAGGFTFNWGQGGASGCAGVDNFSVRFSRRASFAIAGIYTFSASADDGVRVWVDGVQVIDAWKDQGITTYTANRSLAAGMHDLRMEYYENGGGAYAGLSWAYSGGGTNNGEVLEGESTLPSSLTPGETKAVTIRLKNTGSRVWRAADKHALGSWGNNNVNWSGWTCGGYRDGSSNRAGLCRDVNPGETHDFTFNITAPSSGGTSVTLEVRMVQDGVEWFGESQRWAIPVTGAGSVFSTGWENGQPLGYANRVEYVRSVAGYNNSSNPPPEASRVMREAPPMAPNGGSYYLRVAGYSQAAYAYVYFRLFDTNIPIQTGMKLRFWIYPYQRSTFAIDGHFTDGNTMRDLNNGGYLKDQNGVRIHPGVRGVYAAGQWYAIEMDLSRAAGKTLDYLMVAFDNGSDGYIGPIRAYFDNVSIGP